MTKDKSTVYAVLRMFLPILVLLGHAAVMYTPDGAVSPAAGSTFLSALAYYIYSFHMPLFFTLSGALWGYQVQRGKYREAGRFLCTKAQRLLIPYFFFGIFIVAPVIVGFGFTQRSYGSYVLHGILLSEDSRHLWYVLALFWVFVFSIGFRPLLEKIHPAVCLSLSLAILYGSQYLPRSVFQIQAALYYQFFFLAGYYLDRFFDRFYALIRKCRWLPFLALPALLLRFFLPYATPTLLLYNLLGIFMAFGAVTSCACAQLRKLRFFRTLERDSFGLYLFHPMLIYILFYYLAPLGMTPWLLFPLSAVSSGVLSVGLTELLRACKCGILIGEPPAKK